MPIADPYQAKLREALVGAVATKRVRDRRRTVARRGVLAIAAIVAVVATVVTITLPDDRADASIDVEVREGRVFVRLLDFESRPDEIVAAMRNTGIDVVVDEAPVGPSNVGRFVGYTSTQSGAGIHVVRAGSTLAFTSFSVPEDFAGVLRLSLGRRAAVGEQWRASSDATAKDEVLSCRELRGLTALEASHQLAGAPASISWHVVPGGVLEPGAELSPPYDTWRVIEVLSPSQGLVVVNLTADGQWPYLTDPPPQVNPSCKGK